MKYTNTIQKYTCNSQNSYTYKRYIRVILGGTKVSGWHSKNIHKI